MKKIIVFLATLLCFCGIANAWDDTGWDKQNVPYMIKTTAPTVNDADYPVPFLWADTTNDKIYILIDNAPGGAVWQEVIFTGGSPSFATVDLTDITDGNIPYMQGAAAGFGDSPLSTDGTDLTTTGDINAGTVNLIDITDTNIPYMTATGFGDSPLTTDGTDVTAGNDITATQNIAGATYGSDKSISDAELLGLDDGATTELPVGGGTGSAMVWTTATGGGAPVRADTPTLITPEIGAATGTTLNLSGNLQGTTGFAPSATTGAPTTYANDTSIVVAYTLVRVAGDGGATVLDTDPAIADGGKDGQILILQGTHDTNTVQIADACNTALSGNVAFTLGLGDTLSLVWDAGSSIWWELSRSDN